MLQFPTVVGSTRTPGVGVYIRAGEDTDGGPVSLYIGGMYSHSMTPDTAAVSTAGSAEDVMASVDDDDGGVERFVIADISRDDAWLSLPLAEAATLADWQ